MTNCEYGSSCGSCGSSCGGAYTGASSMIDAYSQKTSYSTDNEEELKYNTFGGF